MQHQTFLLRNIGGNTGHGRRSWPVFLLLIIAVALPTLSILWFMGRAMQSERLASRQLLTEIYRNELQSAAAAVQTGWDEKISAIEEISNSRSAPEAFAYLTRSGAVDSILFYKGGRPVYPDVSRVSKILSQPQSQAWQYARTLEQRDDNANTCAEAYRKIAESSENIAEAAQANLARARCLNRGGQTESAIRLLTGTFTDDLFQNAADPRDRQITPNALLFALQLMESPTHPDFEKTANLLYRRLNDYTSPAIPSTQRRFLMQQLMELWPECPNFTTLAAEDMAAAFLNSDSENLEPGHLQQTENPGIWGYQTEDKSAIALFRQENLKTILNQAINDRNPPPGIRLEIQEPGSSNSAFLATDLGSTIPSWNLTVTLDEQDPFTSASNRNITLYLWTGILMTLTIAILSIIIAGYLRRQIRLTRLKNNLIATVTHELKTPLASMRLLVDTLLDGRYKDHQQTLEYLQIISRENNRLSNLIEEFLTFSRMERNKTQFDLKPLQADDFIQPAVDALRDRLQSAGCRFSMDVAPDLPPVRGDRDALTTVLINLLDNALKYSNEEKNIQLRGFSSDGQLCLEVEDNGSGFSRSTARKIFDRFYQADQSLSRSAGGCGLGLSIVQFIVAAHRGEITATSQPGSGSTFTLLLPAD